MHDTLRRGGVESRANLAREIKHFLHGQGVLLQQELIQGFSFDVFHGHVEQAIDLTGVIDGNDVGMIEHAGQAGLITEARQQLAGFRPLHVQTHGLERDGTANGRIQGLVHYAHGALA